MGKTSLLHRFLHGDFDDRYISTIGAKIWTKTLEIPKGEFGGPATLDVALWDIMGMETLLEFLGEAYFQGVNGIIAVCDLTRPDTLKALDHWIEKAKKGAGHVPVYLLANKADLEGQRRISDEQLEEFCRQRGWQFALTSAKAGTQIAEALKKLCSMAMRDGASS